MKIIGFSAKKQGGKTTATRAVQSVYNCVELSVADPLKDIVRQCFIPASWGRLELADDEEKNRILPCGKTIRQALQIVGTDWFRGMWPECWINAFKVRVAEEAAKGAKNIVIPDVRFPNEVEAIQQLGGKIVRLLRAPFVDQDRHESETALDDYGLRAGGSFYAVKEDQYIGFGPENIAGRGFDFVIDNRSMSIQQFREGIERMIREHGLLEKTDGR